MNNQKLKLKDIRDRLENFLGRDKIVPRYDLYNNWPYRDNDDVVDSIKALVNCMIDDILNMESIERKNNLEYDYFPLDYNAMYFIRCYYSYTGKKDAIKKAVYDIIFVLDEINIDKVGVLFNGGHNIHVMKRTLESFSQEFDWVPCDYKNQSIILKNKNSKN